MIALSTDRSLCIGDRAGRVRIDMVEHLLAALSGLSIRRGVHIATACDEFPLLDGGALRFCEALTAIGAPAGEALSLRITKHAELHHKNSVYRFTPPSPENPAQRVTVRVAFPAPVGCAEAEWRGGAEDFQARIAPCRTFGWLSDYAQLRAEHRAAGVDLASVLVFDPARPDGVLEGCDKPRKDEAVHHKLLDCIGDFALYGGPPLGCVDAYLPGHTATHAIVKQALGLGILV